jgi:hypothetical protein
MAYKLILDEKYIVCCEVDVSGVTCVTGWTKNKKKKILPLLQR